MNKCLNTEEIIINKLQLLEYFYSGNKRKSNFGIGIELEKPGVNKTDMKAIPYSGMNGIAAFLKKYGKFENSRCSYEKNSIMGLNTEQGIISLEPGSQIELSNFPQKNIHDIAGQLNYYNRITAELGDEFGIYWLGYAIQPLSTFKDIEIIPKGRYSVMNSYLPSKGSLTRVMMRETAGIQVCIDYESEEDAAKKLKVALGISPVITAMFANSPIRGGKETGFKSFRAHSWLNNDNSRCGLISKKIFEQDFSFSDYVDVLIDLPMVFLKKDDKWINMNGLPFKEYIKNGYNGYKATIDDWFLHMSSFFPDVRLKNFIELRNCDCQRSDLLFSVPALWKGIMYDDKALDHSWNLIKDFTWEERLELRRLVPKYGLNLCFKGFKLIDIAKELVNIADSSLKSMKEMNEDFQDESIYLENLQNILSKNQTPSDIILKYWNTSWNKDLRKLVEYSILR